MEQRTAKDCEDGLEKEEEEESSIPNFVDKGNTPSKLKGKRGKRIRLITNYVKVRVNDKEGIHEYKVTFIPNIDNLELRKEFMEQFDDVLKGQRLFDGMSLFLPFRLLNDVTALRGFHPRSDGTIRMKGVLKYSKPKPYRECVAFFNVLFRRIMMALGKFELRKSFFDPGVKIAVDKLRLEIWPGICSSVEDQEDGLMLCLDTSYRVFRTDTVYEYLCAIRDGKGWRESFKEYIVEKVVVTHYNHFTYPIHEVDWDKNPASLFVCNGQEMTYMDYYKKQYKIDIKDLDQPLLLSRINVKHGFRKTEEIKNIYLVPELCYVCGMKDEHRNDANVMKEIRRYTFCTPAQKIRALTAFVTRANEIPEAKEILKAWNLEIETRMLEVSGREIHHGPAIQFKNRVEEYAQPIFDITASKGFYDAIPLTQWLILCSQRDAKSVKRFQERYRAICIKYGVSSQHLGKLVALKGHSPQDFKEALEDYANPDVFQFVLVVMPYPRLELYSLIKSICCIHKCIPSQVVLSKSLTDDGTFTNTVKKLAMQINCKLGGSLWGLSIPYLDERIMFVGIDVYHDVKKIKPSVVAFVASLNNSCTKYFSLTRAQGVHEEITRDMETVFGEILLGYAEANGVFPDRVIVFRDGGSLSFMPKLLEHEVKTMLAAIKSICPQFKYFTYVTVSKRIPQRFFIRSENGSIVNPKSGTIVDEAVVYPNMFDFYLVSQLRAQPALPTHYMVIYDVGGINADTLQTLVYSTTFMYFNWTGAIRVPAMIQYAHKAAALWGRCLPCNPMQSPPSGEMQKKLYFI